MAFNLFGAMSWWSKWIGFPFQVEHPAVAAFGVIAPGHTPQQTKPIELEAFVRLLTESMRGHGTRHLLMRLCVLLAVSVIRFKHQTISYRTCIGKR